VPRSASSAALSLGSGTICFVLSLSNCASVALTVLGLLGKRWFSRSLSFCLRVASSVGPDEAGDIAEALEYTSGSKRLTSVGAKGGCLRVYCAVVASAGAYATSTATKADVTIANNDAVDTLK
jgi:hypothetical protein